MARVSPTAPNAIGYNKVLLIGLLNLMIYEIDSVSNAPDILPLVAFAEEPDPNCKKLVLSFGINCCPAGVKVPEAIIGPTVLDPNCANDDPEVSSSGQYTKGDSDRILVLSA